MALGSDLTNHVAGILLVAEQGRESVASRMDASFKAGSFYYCRLADTPPLPCKCYVSNHYYSCDSKRSHSGSGITTEFQD
jgi:hypothetical protein